MARGATGFLALALCAATPAGAQLSENPVRSDQVVISWPAPAATGQGGAGGAGARVSIFTFRGEQLHQATVAAPDSEYVWDLNAGARRVVNGAYIVVVEVDGRRYRHRLFVARKAP